LANLGIIHRAIKSAGRRYTISLLVNCTGNSELRSFCYSMLHPNNFNTKAMVTCKRSAAVAKKLTNSEHLALSKTKKQTQVASGLHQPCTLCCCHWKHIKSTVPTDSRVMTKKNTFPLNHSLACASYTIYLAIHTCICKEGRKNRKSNDEKSG